jgi:hypothetical protein
VRAWGSIGGGNFGVSGPARVEGEHGSASNSTAKRD